MAHPKQHTNNPASNLGLASEIAIFNLPNTL